jgi:hypothetical protein
MLAAPRRQIVTAIMHRHERYIHHSHGKSPQ